jgi:hypothetical protein
MVDHITLAIARVPSMIHLGVALVQQHLHHFSVPVPRCHEEGHPATAVLHKVGVDLTWWYWRWFV